MRYAFLLFLAMIPLSCKRDSNPRDPVIQERLQEWGLEAFPEDGDAVWELRKTSHKDDFSVVEAEPSPNQTGYPRARLVIHWTGSTPDLIACLVLDDKHWTQMFEDAGAPADWRKKSGLE